MTENAKEGGEKLGLSASERESEKNNVKPQIEEKQDPIVVPRVEVDQLVKQMEADLAPNYKSEFVQEVPVVRQQSEQFPAQAITPEEDPDDYIQPNIQQYRLMQQTQFVQKQSNLDVLQSMMSDRDRKLRTSG